MPSLERDTLLAESKTILKSVTNWKPGKQFKSNVIPETITTSTYSTTNIRDNQFWCARESLIPSAYKQKVIDCLIGTANIGSTHSDHEVNYVEEFDSLKISNVTEYPDGGWSYELHANYKFGTIGISNRMFYESVHIYKFDKNNQTEEDDKDTNCAYIISVPIDGPTGSFVIGKYHSIEKISWSDNKDSDLKWIMATTSDAGGYLPRWLTNMILPGAISNDVPSVLKYIQ